MELVHTNVETSETLREKKTAGGVALMKTAVDSAGSFPVTVRLASQRELNAFLSLRKDLRPNSFLRLRKGLSPSSFLSQPPASAEVFARLR